MLDRIKARSGSHLFVLIVLWLLAIIIVDPLREFPLNDDWVYTWSVLQLMENGGFMIHPWVAVTLVSHILWGSVFTGIFGFSFTVLRISTLIMSLGGVLVSYKLFEELIKDRQKALWFSLFIAFNPVYFNLSFTFMTDLTFYAMVVLSGLYYIRSFREGDRYSIYLATLFSVFAVLTRQVGLFVPLSALLTAIVIQRGIINRKVLVYLLHALFAAVVMFGYIFWLERTAGKPESFRDVGQFVDSGNFILVILQRMVDHTGRWLAETGLWFLPLIFFFTWRTWNHFKGYFLSAGILTALLSVPIVLQTSHFPGGNVFYVIGLGPPTLADAYLFGMREWGTLQETLTPILRSMALAGGVMLAWLILAGTFDVFNRLRKQKDDLNIAKLFSLVLILTYQAVFLGSFTYFDRYGIILFVPVLILIFPRTGLGTKPIRWENAVVAIFLAVLLVFSVTATRDYLTWNQMRWEAASILEENGVPPQAIDGGHEYNGWHGTTFDKYGRWDPGEFEYILTFRPMEGYEVVDKKPYRRLMPFRKEEIFVLKKKTEE